MSSQGAGKSHYPIERSLHGVALNDVHISVDVCSVVNGVLQEGESKPIGVTRDGKQASVPAYCQVSHTRYSIHFMPASAQFDDPVAMSCRCGCRRMTWQIRAFWLPRTCLRLSSCASHPKAVRHACRALPYIDDASSIHHVFHGGSYIDSVESLLYLALWQARTCLAQCPATRSQAWL